LTVQGLSPCQTLSLVGCSLPATGSLGSVPPLHRYYQALRLPAAPPALLRFLASRYRHAPWTSLPQPQDATAAGLGLFTGIPKPVSLTETTGPPRFLEDPAMNVPCSSTPAGPLRSATAAHWCCLPLFGRRRLPRFPHFGAQSHGPRTRCRRFAEWVAPPPRKTHFRIAGQPFRVD
jgi:hypothetical protein